MLLKSWMEATRSFRLLQLLLLLVHSSQCGHVKDHHDLKGPLRFWVVEGYKSPNSTFIRKSCRVVADFLFFHRILGSFFFLFVINGCMRTGFGDCRRRSYIRGDYFENTKNSTNVWKNGLTGIGTDIDTSWSWCILRTAAPSDKLVGSCLFQNYNTDRNWISMDWYI